MMEIGKKIVFSLFLCCIVAGCVDSGSATKRTSHRRHYSDLIDQRGEPTEVISDGTGGAIFSYSPLPIEEALQQERDNFLVHEVYRVDHQGYVYP